MTFQEPVLVSGIWLRRSGTRIVVAVEFNSMWHDVIVESQDRDFNRIVEPLGIETSPESFT